MKFVLKNESAAKASVVWRNKTPCLLVHFYASTPPMVWQMDLEKASNTAILLQEKDGLWCFGYGEPGKDFTVVAKFSNRIDAEDAYQRIQKVIDKGEGMSFRRVANMIFYLVLIFFILSLFFGPKARDAVELAPENAAAPATPAVQGFQFGGGEPQSAPAAEEDQSKKFGVPLDADSVLPSVP
ncbi:MAG: hypothetical protein EOM37_08305 [Proteobacteria bacterium]|nr:hypothetical protein [Pseudomonadota bacterium]